MIGQGISALDPTVGLLQKELEVNNVQPGQEAQYFQSKGRPLSPQLVFLIQANQQLKKDAQAMQARPPQGTVADDLSAALVQKANSGIAAQMPRMNPREQGIARLPAEIGGERAYAGGGIVAFAEGGWTPDKQAELDKLNRLATEGLDFGAEGTGQGIYGIAGQEEAANATLARRRALTIEKQKWEAEQAAAKRQNAAREAASRFGIDIPPPAQAAPAAPAAQTVPPAAPVSPGIMAPATRRPVAAAPATDIVPSAAPAAKAAPSPLDTLGESFQKEADKTKEERLKEAADKWEKSGVNRAEAERLARLDARTAAMPEDRKRDLMMQLAASAFGSVGKGRTFAQSLGNIGSGFAQGAISVEQKYKDMKNLLEDSKDKMAEAQAYRKAGDFDSAAKAEAEARDKQRQFLVQRETLNETERRHREQMELGERQIRSHERIAASNRDAAITRAAMLAARTQTMTPAQIANLREKAISKLDMDAIRSRVAAAMQLKKPPKPGAEPQFEKAVAAARERDIAEHMADVLQIPQSTTYSAVMGTPVSADSE